MTLRLTILAIIGWLLLATAAGGQIECRPDPAYPERCMVKDPPNDGGSRNGASPS